MQDASKSGHAQNMQGLVQGDGSTLSPPGADFLIILFQVRARPDPRCLACLASGCERLGQSALRQAGVVRATMDILTIAKHATYTTHSHNDAAMTSSTLYNHRPLHFLVCSSSSNASVNSHLKQSPSSHASCVTGGMCALSFFGGASGSHFFFLSLPSSGLGVSSEVSLPRPVHGHLNFHSLDVEGPTSDDTEGAVSLQGGGSSGSPG